MSSATEADKIQAGHGGEITGPKNGVDSQGRSHGLLFR